MTLHLAESDATGLFNIGTGTPHTWLELVGPIFRALELPERIEFVEMPRHLRGQVSVLYLRAHGSGSTPTGYDRPLTPLGDAVTDYVTNYLVPQRPLELADAPVAAPLKASICKKGTPCHNPVAPNAAVNNAAAPLLLRAAIRCAPIYIGIGDCARRADPSLRRL